MDLKLEEVAELLNVSEKTIKRWVSDSKIPYYRLNQQFRFNRSEIEDWVLSCRQEKDFSPFEEGGGREKIGRHQFGLFRAIHRGGVYQDVPGKTKEEVIRFSMQKIAEDLHLDAEVLTDLLIDRENLMSTALSNGIAVPHTRDFLLQESYDVVSVVFPKKPIEFGSLDKKPVHTLFFLFACDDKRHLNLLAKIAHLSSKKEHLEFMQKKPDKGQFLDFVKNWEGHLKS